MNTCFECGGPAEMEHHPVPVSRGGTQTIWLCGECHAKAHHLDGNMAHSQLTREGLARAKAAGVLLGSQRPGHWDGREHLRGWEAGVARSVVARKDRVMSKAMLLAPLVLELRALYPLAGVADVMNNMGIPTSRGKRWSPAAVHRLLGYIEDAQAADDPTGPTATRLKLEYQQLCRE